MEIQVSFPSGGEQVCGMLHVPERTPGAGVVLCHGFTGSKSEAHRLFIHAARDFCRHGLVILRFDFRGSGDSEGEFQDMTIHREVEDAHAAFDFLAARPEVDSARVGMLGLSLGGCVAACFSGREPRLKGLVLWSAVAHPGRIFERILPAFEEGPWADFGGWGLGRAFLDSAREVQPLAGVRAYAGPALVVHGEKDETVPASDAADYQAAMGERSRVHYVEGADHTFSSFPWTGEAVRESREFFLQALRT